MLRCALAFLIFAVVAAFLGFGGVAATAVGMARTLFFVFLVVFLVTFLASLISGRRRPL